MTFVGLIYNIYLMVVCVMDGTIDRYLKLLAYLSEAATVTGPVAIWGATLLWMVCNIQKNPD